MVILKATKYTLNIYHQLPLGNMTWHLLICVDHVVTIAKKSQEYKNI